MFFLLPFLRRKPLRHGCIIHIAAEPVDILGAVGIQREEMFPCAALEHGVSEAWGQRAAEQRTSTVRERRKEPREGSEIDPETACIQKVGARKGDGVPFV